MNSRFRVIVGGMYVMAGTYILITETMPERFEPALLKMLGIVFIAYGLYRVVHTRLINSTNENLDFNDGDKQNNDSTNVHR